MASILLDATPSLPKFKLKSQIPMSLVLPSALLLILVAAEAFILSWHQKKSIPWRQLVFNMNSGHVILWMFRGLEVAAFHFVFERFSLNLVANWKYGVLFALAFIAWDFCFYWLHRLHHHIGILWAVHVIHHEGEHFSLSLGIRNSWYSSLTSIPFFLILALVGIPTEVFVAVGAIHYFVQFYNHNALVNRSGLLESFMITPSHHRVHHGKNAPYVDRNFGGTLLIWDKLFGTFQAELDDCPIQFGTHDHVATNDIIAANNLPWLKLLGIQLPVIPPVYRTLKPAMIWSSGVLSFVLFLMYLHAEIHWPPLDRNVLFAYGIGSVIAVGGLSEGRKWGQWSWTAVQAMAIIACAMLESWQSPFLMIWIGFSFLHSIGTWRKAMWAKVPTIAPSVAR